MNRLRTVLIWITLIVTLLWYIPPARAQQPERVAVSQDPLQKALIQTEHTLDNQPVVPEFQESVSGEEVVMEERPDSAAIMSQTELLLEQMHAGTLLFPSYQMNADTDGKSAHRKFSHGLIAGAQREDLIGLMGIERGILGYGMGYGPLSLQAYATADKYGSFRNLTTVFGVGGSLTLDITDWMSVTAFGAYYNKAPYMGMAAYPYVNTSNYGGYMTFKTSGTFGMSLGVRRDYDPITRRYYTNPIVMPSLKVNNAIFSVDLGPVINEAFHMFNRPKMPAGPMMGPPGPRLLKPAGPLK